MNLLQLILYALVLGRGVLQLEPAIFQVLLDNPAARFVPTTLLFLAGLSDVLGQSVVLFANRVKPGRFVVSIVASVIVLIISVFVWAVSIWLTGWFIFGSNQSFVNILRVVQASYAPLIFGIFIFIPYLGNIIFRLLRIWVFLALLVGVQVAYPINFWQALFCCMGGWIVYELMTRLPALPLEGLSRWWWRVTTGTPEPLDIQARADQVAEQAAMFVRRRAKN
ncbi:MAG: hypothetical protein KDI79_08270 [Anaerolineae bacterium]|nr:hypothetical protein [Anaerolineae bacterium]